jgi:hypothetical protein
MPEVATSGDASMVPSNVHIGPTNVHMGPPSAEVTSTKVTAADVAATKVTAAAVSATSVTASTTSKGRCRDCRTTQKDSGDGYEQCFSHQDLHHSVSSTKPYRRIFPSLTRSSGQCSSTTSYDCAMGKLSASASTAIKLSVSLGADSSSNLKEWLWDFDARPLEAGDRAESARAQGRPARGSPEPSFSRRMASSRHIRSAPSRRRSVPTEGSASSSQTAS